MERNTRTTEQQWRSMFARLQVYRVEHGNCDVPRSFRTKDGHGLGAWLHRQRSLNSAGRLPEARRDLLAAEGVQWTVLDRSRALAALRVYLQHFGNLRVPADYRLADGLALGTWVQSRRAEYRRDPERTLRLWPELAAMPFDWAPRADLWEPAVLALEQYRRDYGDSRVPYWYETPDGLRLGKWLDTRRTEYRAGALASDRVAALVALDVEWNLRVVSDTVARDAREDAHFTAMLSATARWIRTHDGQAPPVRQVDANGAAIGRWFGRLRSQLRDGSVPPRRFAEIDQRLPGLRRSVNADC